MSKKISLKAARLLVGLSQKDAANKFGVHYQTLASWEENPKKMKREYLELLPEVYFISEDSIFFGDENEFNRYYRKRTC
ncbi:helix-turn-helix transcriptional regulator [Enterococcus sp. BWM-S5]|uniref:Helix-turn-helix transcriptional regulator n=1 Tax=Enterococcus larvae TaxID=2794352 RepID=A0ABS4CEG7_9ENTE|nr:helix-turn-helix transcriptional regulator [Enterococcus larvae]